MDCVLLVDEEGEDCLAIGYLGIQFNKKTKKEIQMLLFGINNHMSRGIWQTEDGDGDVRYVKCLPVEGDATITHEMLENLVYGLTGTVQKFADSIMAVAAGYATSAEELRKLFEDEDTAEPIMDETEINQGVEIETDESEDVILWMKTKKNSK